MYLVIRKQMIDFVKNLILAPEEMLYWAVVRNKETTAL